MGNYAKVYDGRIRQGKKIIDETEEKDMDKETINTAYEEITDFLNKLGETFYDAVQEDDNFTYDMAKGIIKVFNHCDTKEKFEIADAMLIAVCGYSFETLLERIKERDRNGYVWERDRWREWFNGIGLF